MNEEKELRRARAHLERAEQLGTKVETAATEGEQRRAALKQLLHTIAAINAVQAAYGAITRTEIRANRPRLGGRSTRSG